MEHKESFGVSVSTPRSNAKGPAVETPHGGNSVPRDTAPAKETSRTGEEPPREEEKDEEKPADGEKSHPMDFSSPGSKSLPSIGSPISVETATKQTIHVIRRKPVGGAAAALRPRPLQVVREGGPAEKRINADDDEHNFKYCVVEPPVHVLVEEKIVAQTPEEKVLVGNVLVPHQQDPDKILVVQNLPHQQDADKIPVFGGDDAPIARPATAEGRVQQQKSRHDDMFGSAARELGLGVAHITGSVLKVTAAGPTLMSRSLERSQSNISNSGSRRKKDDGEGDQDKGSVKSEPVEYYEPTITGWRSGMTAARTGMYRGMYDGVTGIFTQPYLGAREEGAKGFLKGCGKGLSGALLKPSAGLVGAPGHALMGAYREVQKSVDKLESSASDSANKRRPSLRSGSETEAVGAGAARPSSSATR